MSDLEAPVQILIGSNIVNLYERQQDKGFLKKLVGGGTSYGNGLMEAISAKRREMEQYGISLPQVHIVEERTLPPNQFIVTVALNSYRGDISKDNLFGVVESMVLALQMREPSKVAVGQLLSEGIELLENKNYQDALVCFRMCTYWGMVLENCQAECVRAILGYGIIQMINNQFDSMLYDTNVACQISENTTFGDPYLRHYSHRLKGTALLLLNLPEEAISYFLQAYHDLEWSSDCRPLVEVLFHAVTALLQCEQYDSCRELLDKIYMLVKDNDIYDKSAINELYNFRAFVSDKTIGQLKMELSVIAEKYESLSRSFLLKLSDTLVNVVKTQGPFYITCAVGSILGNPPANAAFFGGKINNQNNYFNY